jgi:hypothetical protein
MLTIAAFAELFLGVYFVLAFFAWCAKLYLFTTAQPPFSFMLVVWLALAGTSFGMYFVTSRKMKNLD